MAAGALREAGGAFACFAGVECLSLGDKAVGETHALGFLAGDAAVRANHGGGSA